MKKNKPFIYEQSEQAVLEQLATNPKEGLTTAQVAEHREKFGENELNSDEKTSLFEKFINQFKDFMIIVLVIASLVSWTVSGDVSDAVLILLVVLLNAVMGVFQESKAEEAIDALRKMASPSAHVLRDGHVETLRSTELVPGDIVLLEAGDVVPADMRLLEANSLKVEEAALTGESVPVEKTVTVLDGKVGIGDRVNMLFSNTNITYGRAVGVVTATGMATEVGKIADMLSSTETQKTPLQRDQDNLGKVLTYLIIGIAVVTFLVGTLWQGVAWDHMLLIAVSLAVAAIPEGLPPISTIVLSIGTRNMAKRNALIRSLPAVETMGSTQVICSDKTGTLTMNQMTVEQNYADRTVYGRDVSGDIQKKLAEIMALANDTEIDADDELIGDPTETALVQFALDQGLDLTDLSSSLPRVAELPFDSDRKLMSTFHKMPDGKIIMFTKGAPDQLLQRAEMLETATGIDPLTDTDREEIFSANDAFARQALRVLAGAYKVFEELPEELETGVVEKDLIFVGLTAMIDPERPEARASIQEARQAGIRTVMITGDHAVTAQAIAERLTILDPKDDDNNRHVLTGHELDQISQEELEQKVADFSVYARVSPEHKVRIVKAWQANGQVVAMTGDGVNDAPSLKQADIGVGMGITGTEVSKGASDMVLADDNFATIVHAVEEGRKVFSNIQKTVQYLLSANLGEVLTLFVATLVGWQILEPIHILWINLVTDVFPAIALGMERGEAESMELEPRSKDSTFLSNGVLPSIIYQGVLEAGITLFVYWVARYHYAPMYWTDQTHIINLAETMAFMTLGMMQLFHTYNVKSVFHSLLTMPVFDNKYLNWATLGSGLMLVMVVLTPGLNKLFDITEPNVWGWLIVLGSSLAFVVIVELIKALFRLTGWDRKYRKRAVVKK